MQINWKKVVAIFIVVIAPVTQQSLAKDINIATVHIGNRGYIDLDGKEQGSSYEIVNAIVEGAGFTHRNHLIPFGRIIRYLETGEVEAALLVPNETVNEVAIPLVHVQDVDFIFVGKPSLKLNQLKDVEGKHVGYLRLSPTAEKVIKPLNIYKVAGGRYSHMIEMLMRDRIDVLFGPKSNIFWTLKQLGYSPEDLGEPLSVYKLELHLVYSKKTADVETIAALIASTNKLKKNNVIKDIINKYDNSVVK